MATGQAGGLAPMRRAIPTWHRFHIRLTALYAVAVFGVVLPMGVFFYQAGARQELTGLQERLVSTATALAVGIDVEALRTITSEADRGGAAFAALERRLAAVTAADAEMRNIYILLRNGGVHELTFVIDHDRDRPDDTAAIGDRYDARQFPKMIAAFDGPSVEDEVTADAWGPSLAGWVPLRDRSGAAVGLLGIDVLGRRVEAARRQVLIVTAAVSLLALLLLGLAAVAVGRNVRAPLGRMIDASSRIAAGDFDARVGLDRPDEFGLVGEHFDTMATGLEERDFIRDTFGRYVSRDVAQALLADRSQTRLGGEMRVVTVLFSDLRGYSTIAEHLAPAEVVDLLNRYLGAMNGVVDAHGGVVIEFLGDAILAVFGAPNALDDHATAAVRCAEAMAAELDALNVAWERDGLARRWQDVGLARLSQRIGVHSGEVIAGNLGSRARAKYAVIGDTVNVASRLEQLNKEIGSDSDGSSQLLFSDAVYAALPAELRARCTRRGEFVVKGRAQRVEAWSLIKSTTAG